MFVTFEGIEGSGKTTQVKRLASWLEARRYDFVRTVEPGGTQPGQAIRAILLDPANRGLTPQVELHLFLADRAQHITEVIRPALEAGRLVVCDRYGDSTVAYQGARGLDPWTLLAEAEAEFPVPDLTLLFALPVEEGLRRVEQRGEPREPAFERADFLERVAAIFDALASRRDGIVRIDALGSVDEVAGRVRAALAPLTGGGSG